MHPAYNLTEGVRRGYDIGLLRLAEEVDLNVHTPACLPESGKDYTGQMGTVYGKNKIYIKLETFVYIWSNMLVLEIFAKIYRIFRI